MSKFSPFAAIIVCCLIVTGCSSRLEPAPKGSPSATMPAKQRPALAMQSWADIHAVPYGIPKVALEAYAWAAAQTAKAAPQCHIDWATIAAVGIVQTNNGNIAGSRLEEDGEVLPHLRGVVPGTVQDTDGGHYDQNPAKDVRIGPMQFMPTVWEQFATDGNDDGVLDPDNIDDAAMSLGKMLCAYGDLGTPDGWERAMKRYYDGPGFIRTVHAKAIELAR